MNFVHSLVKISKVSGYAFLTAWLGVQLLGPDGLAEIINGTVNEKDEIILIY